MADNRNTNPFEQQGAGGQSGGPRDQQAPGRNPQPPDELFPGQDGEQEDVDQGEGRQDQTRR